MYSSWLPLSRQKSRHAARIIPAREGSTFPLQQALKERGASLILDIIQFLCRSNSSLDLHASLRRWTMHCDNRLCRPFLILRCMGIRRSDNLSSLIVGRDQIHLSIERRRVCETSFAPRTTDAGVAGLGEGLKTVISSFSLGDCSLFRDSILYPFLSYGPLAFPSRFSPLYCPSINGTSS
jgi:hypothetical protein